MKHLFHFNYNFSLLMGFIFFFYATYDASAQKKFIYNKFLFNNPYSKLSVNKQYYVSLSFPLGTGGRCAIPVYSSIAGPEKKLAMQLNSCNVYIIQPMPNSARDKYYKLFNYDGKYLGYIYERHFALCEKPKAPNIEMVKIDGGTFEMGDNTDSNASPVHQVTLSDFQIAKYEISLDQWRSIMGEEVTTEISWYDVQNYIAILNKLTGKKYRLPTEAEWEYAARGGNMSKDYVYSGSNDINVVGVCKENSRAWNGREETLMRRKPGILMPNELGIYDMSGNVWEFCADHYDFYTDEPKVNPLCLKNDKEAPRVLRGGGYLDSKDYCNTRKRSYVYPWFPNSSYGFRLVLGEPDKTLQAPSTTIDENAQIVSISEGIIVYHKEEKYGMARENDKKIILHPKYDWISPVHDGGAIVKIDCKFGYLDKNGKMKLPCDYDTIKVIHHPHYIIVKNNKKGLMTSSGKILLSCDYDDIKISGEHSFYVRKEDIVGVLSTNGSWMIPLKFQNISPMDEYGYCWVKLNGKIMLTKDYSNMYFTPFDADSVYIQTSTSKALVESSVLSKAPNTAMEVYYFRKGSHVGAYCTNGTINCEFDELGIVNDNECIWAQKNNGYIIIDMNGKTISKEVYDKVAINSQNNLQILDVQTSSFKDREYYFVEKGRLKGIINNQGKTIVPLKYEEIDFFYEDLALVKSDGKYGFINKSGQSVIPCQFDSAKHFSDGMAAVELEGKRGFAFINKEGFVVIKSQKYDEVGYFVDGCCLVRKGNKTYYINKEGKKIKK